MWPKQKVSGPDCLIIAFLAAGCGLGIISLIYFIWLAAAWPFSLFILSEIAILAALGWLIYHAYKNKKLPQYVGFDTDILPKTKIDMFAAAALIVMICASVVFYVHYSFRMPHGEWDAWAIWNMRARFLFREGSIFKSTFSPALFWSHPDYPLLLPASIVRFWNYIGKETQLVPAVMSAVFTFSTAGLVFSSLFKLRGMREALLGAIVLLGTQVFMMTGASQYADVPLSYFILATLVLFCLHDRLEIPARGFLILSGVMAGLAGWTKNEGLLFLMLVVFVRFVTVAIFNGRKKALVELLIFSSGALPVLAVIIYFKLRFAPPNDLFSQGPAAIMVKLTDLSIYYPILKVVWGRLLGFGAPILGVIPLLAAYLSLAGVRVEKKDLPMVAVWLGVSGMMLLLYIGVYAISPYNAAWLISTSIDRLISQLWPSTVFMVFLIIRNDAS